MKIAIGLLLCFFIGGACRFFQVPVPAPPVLLGALLVVAMTAGYLLTDRLLAQRPASNKHLCAGPSGTTKVEADKREK